MNPIAFFLATIAASPGSVEFDIQCMVALQTAAEQAPESEKSDLQIGTYFYFGRIDSVLSGKALEDRILEVGDSVANAALQPIIHACGAFMADRGENLVDVGQRVEERERARATR